MLSKLGELWKLMGLNRMLYEKNGKVEGLIRCDVNIGLHIVFHVLMSWN